jgi:hypothetical protein
MTVISRAIVPEHSYCAALQNNFCSTSSIYLRFDCAFYKPLNRASSPGPRVARAIAQTSEYAPLTPDSLAAEGFIGVVHRITINALGHQIV